MGLLNWIFLAVIWTELAALFGIKFGRFLREGSDD